jgi:hypothetical protein
MRIMLTGSVRADCTVHSNSARILQNIYKAILITELEEAKPQGSKRDSFGPPR